MDSSDGYVQSQDTKHLTRSGFMKNKKLGYLMHYFRLLEYYSIGILMNQRRRMAIYRCLVYCVKINKSSDMPISHLNSLRAGFIYLFNLLEPYNMRFSLSQK